jgi:diguanylate cyclase (GGDEF)-like protein/PAS domain S-box-containing protein
VLAAVAAREADAGVVNRVMSILRAADYGVLATGIVFNPVEVRYATPKGRNSDVLRAIDNALRSQKQSSDSAYQHALDRWLTRVAPTSIPQWLPAATAATGLVIVLLIANIYFVRRRVARRTTELSDSEERFRQLAENIREVFWIGSPSWDQVLYVSPAFEAVWGRSADSLYADPMSWLQAVHPDDRQQVVDAIRNKTPSDFADPALPDYRIRDAEGRTRWIQARAYPIRDAQGHVVRVAGLAEDITERKASEEKIRFMAFHDPLTRLYNRHAFEAELKKAMQEAEPHQHALMYVDLDQFKVINDTCGHTAGDQMLQGLTAQLREAVGDESVLARLGGDEFGILMKHCDLPHAQRAAREVLDTISAFRFVWEQQTFSVGASIGLVMMEGGGRPLSSLLSAADIACYEAKERGRNRVHLYHDDDKILLQRQDEMHWVPRLKEAIENDGFILYAQPIAPLAAAAGSVTHRELLLRLKGTDGTEIPPADFIPAAERFDLMPALDRWVVAHTCRTICSHDSTVSGIVFVNLSGQVLNDEGFASFVVAQMQAYRVPQGRLCFEITETSAIANLAKATRLIERLRGQGVLFALDDFGTGMSSFGYLKTLPVDFLKIDGFFIKGLLDEQMNAAIVEAITRVGHTAGLMVVAEWVEDTHTLERLHELGIDFAQGYAIGHPAPLDTAGGTAGSSLAGRPSR